MNILLLRCANGPVGWYLKDKSLTQSFARCLNDQFTIELDSYKDADVIAYLTAIFAHSTQLRGAINLATQVTI